MNVLSLFAGIGGLELGLERAGMTVVGQVELDPWARQVLAKHWPDTPRHDDVRSAPEWWTSEERPDVDLVCGGFPCQDISLAGRGVGIGGERSGLWKAMLDTIRAVRPRYVLIENVAALAFRGLDVVLADLASIGFDAEWGTVSACAVGAPHMRKRLFVVAYPAGVGRERRGGFGQVAPAVELEGCGAEQVREWPARPEGVGVAYGIPRRMDRLRGLGNSVVPQVAEHLGRLILEDAAVAA